MQENNNYQIILTRSFQDNSWLENKLQAAGIAVESCPSIKFVTLALTLEKKELIESFLEGKFSHVIFSSKNAVICFQQILSSDFEKFAWPSAVQVAVVGKKTAQTFKKYWGFYPQIVAEESGAKHLVQNLNLLVANASYLLVRPNKSLEQVEQEFLKLKGKLSRLEIYETKNIFSKEYLLKVNLQKEKIFVFFSPSAFTSSLESFGDSFLRNSKIISIGNTTSNFIRQKGFNVCAQGKEATEEAVLDEILKITNR